MENQVKDALSPVKEELEKVRNDLQYDVEQLTSLHEALKQANMKAGQEIYQSGGEQQEN